MPLHILDENAWVNQEIAGIIYVIFYKDCSCLGPHEGQMIDVTDRTRHDTMGYTKTLS